MAEREGHMSLVKVKIAEVGKIEDKEGKFGPQKWVKIRESLEGGDRWLTGYIDLNKFTHGDWVPGKVHELEVWQKEKYWNFKFPTQKNKESDEVMKALREIYKKLNEIEAKLDQRKPSNGGMPHPADYDDAFGEPQF